MEETQAEPVKPDQALLNAEFSDIHFRAGEILIAQPLVGLDAESFSVSYIGAHGGLSFLTTLPIVGNKGMWISPNSTFKFRAVHGMYVYAFTSRCLRARSRPYSYAHFAIPEDVKCRQIRQSHRLEIRMPTEINRNDGSRVMAILRDVSQHGAKLELTEELGEIGAEVTLTIPIVLPGVTSSMSVTATIRNNNKRAVAAGRFLYGVSFAPLSADDGVLLQRFIDHLLVEQLA